MDSPFYVTFLRDPCERLQSHLAHHLAAGTAFHAGGRTISLREAFEDGVNEEFDNLIVRYIAGLPESIIPCGQIDESAVDLALDNVTKHFAFVGFVSSMAEDVARLSSILGYQVALPGVENIREPRQDFNAIRQRFDWDRVIQRNRFDIMLYERLRDIRNYSDPAGRAEAQSAQQQCTLFP